MSRCTCGQGLAAVADGGGGTDAVGAGPFIAERALVTMERWRKPKFPDTARNMAMLRIAKVYGRLTNKGTGFSTDRNENNPERKHYSSLRSGDLLDFFTKACEITGIEKNANAAVRNLVKLKIENPAFF